MYKSKLQEYCQAKSWDLPVYSTTKEGHDHCPQFKATVIVNGATFSTPDFWKSSKEAQNMVARIAFDCLGSLSGNSRLSIPLSESIVQQPRTNDSLQVAFVSGVNSPISDNKNSKREAGCLSGNSKLPLMPIPGIVQQPKTKDTLEAGLMSAVKSPIRDDNNKEMTHLYKNKLQIYAQKRNLLLPVYTYECKGPAHACRFRSKVTLKEKTYECPEYFGTIKDADNAAAKVALMELSCDETQEEDPFVFKNLLQELAQKEYSSLPEYKTTRFGAPHMPVFVSTVEINEMLFTGQEARTKKLAEMNAAKIAHAALKECQMKLKSEPCSPGSHIGTSRSSLQLHSTGMVESSQINSPESKLNCNKGVNEKVAGSKPGKKEMKSLHAAPFQSASIFNQNTIMEPWTDTDASSIQKTVKVYPYMPDMTFPLDTIVLHKDDKWVAVTRKHLEENQAFIKEHTHFPHIWSLDIAFLGSRILKPRWRL